MDKTFLIHRSARVLVDGPSHCFLLPEGVLEGGVISPTLFLEFIE